IIGKTQVSNANLAYGYPVVAPSVDSTTDWYACVTHNDVLTANWPSAMIAWNKSNGSLNAYVTYQNQSPVIKPFAAGAGMYVVTVDRDLDAVDPAQYGIADLGANPRVELVFGQNIAQPADNASTCHDPRQYVMSSVSPVIGQD